VLYDGEFHLGTQNKPFRGERTFNGPANAEDVAAAILLPEGLNNGKDMFVTGRIWAGASGDDFLTHRYRDDAP
jgi:hypothetical protein